MANRSYLYATDILPAPGVHPADGRMIGISEWNYDIPLAFRWLLTAQPRTAISSIWQVPEQITIVGEYAGGVARLLTELDQHAHPALTPLREEARAFLTDPANQRKYLVLECNEIYEMEDGTSEEQNAKLLGEIVALSTPHPASQPPDPPSKKGLLARLFGRPKKPVPPVDWDQYGLGNWSNVLFFDPAPSPNATPSTE